MSGTLAQEESATSVEVSEEFNIPKGTVLESIIFANSTHVYLLRKNYPGNPLSGVSGGLGTKLKSVIIESYDRETLKLHKAIDIDLKFQKKLRTFHGIFNAKGKLFFITSFFNSTKRKNYLFAQKLDAKFSPSEDMILIGEIDSRSEAHTGDFRLQHSRDTSKIIIFHDLPTKRSENEQAKLSVYDENFELLWKKKVNMPYESKLYERIKFQVDNDGNAFILGKHYFEKRKSSVKQKPNYEFVMESFTALGEEKEKYQLNDRDKFISDLTFEVNKKRQIICTGFYSNEKIRSSNSSSARGGQSIGGIVYFKIDDQNKQIDEKSFTPFDLDFITLNDSENAKRKQERRANDNNDRNDPALYSYDFRDVILRSDGGAVIIAEQFYVEGYDNFNDPLSQGGRLGNRSNFYRNDSTYYYNDIIVVNINPDGSIRWANAVPKYQVASSAYQTRYLSFANAAYQDKIYMVFNEKTELFESGSTSGSKLFNGSNKSQGLALATLNKLGELEIDLLSSNDEMGIRVLPKLTKQIGKKELIFYGEYDNKFRIGQILLD